MRFYEFFRESKEVNMSIKIRKTLSYEAERLLDNWQHYDFSEDSQLVKAIQSNSNAAKELYSAFEPVRRYLKARNGTTIKLYRGVIGRYDPTQDTFLSSWSSNSKDAEMFANKRDLDGHNMIPKQITDAEVSSAIKKFNQTGYTTFLGKKYMLNKKDPEFYNIYDRNNQYITDGDTVEFANTLKRKQAEMNNKGNEISNRGQVIAHVRVQTFEQEY